MIKILKWVVGCSLFAVMPFAAANNSKMTQVFSYDMIGVDVAYLESIIGIARQTDTHFKTKRYIVDGCQLEVGYQDQSVVTLSVDLTDQCRFNLQDVISFNDTISSDKLVFGMTGPVTYYADCLGFCGNAYEPSVHELYQGPRAENFRELLLSSVSDSYEARSKWRDTMIAKEGENWVMEGRFNCEPQKYSDVAEKALKGEKVDQITIGYHLESRKQLQFGCDDLETESAIDKPVNTQNTGVTERPFEIVYEDQDYTYLLGSQVLSGEIFYEPNDMYGHQILFTPDAASSQRIGLMPNSSFVLDEYTQMNQEQLMAANYHLEFNVDFESSRFQNSYCTIKGPATFQIIGISLYLPEESEPHVYMRSLKKIASGPFAVNCER